jgi:hypothetical protein
MLSHSDFEHAPAWDVPIAPAPTPVVEFAEVSFTHAPDLRQLTLAHANPLCGLLEQTAQGCAVCNRGCGLSVAPPATREHLCPFGMVMLRLDRANEPRPYVTRWIGRRFVSVAALHRALDHLAAAGIGEEAIFEAVPPNPVVNHEELIEAVHERSRAAIVPVPIHSGPAAEARNGSLCVAPAPPPAGGTRDAIFEFLSQVQRLLSTTADPQALGVRFLKAAGSALPFDRGAIVAALRHGTDPGSLATIGEGEDLSAHPLVARVLATPCALTESGGAVQPMTETFRGGATLALPLTAGADVLGVWIAHWPAGEAVSPLVGEPLRLLRLLADLLAGRLELVRHLRRAPEPVETPIEISASECVPAETADEALQSDLPPAAFSPAILRAEADTADAQWTRARLLDELRPEVARARRLDANVALIQLTLRGPADGGAAPVEAIASALDRARRLYDRLGTAAGQPASWFFILPQVDRAQARAAATRMQGLVEDVLDSHGGFEEQGYRLGLGISMLGIDAADASQMTVHASAAVEAALASADAEAIRLFDAHSSAVGM